ncbi:MAG TPA: transporter substrate-binding domain-containing protein [Burkholderiaceae bacterium]|jgi:polar amino acid transport system substrate-binding protein
MFAFVRLGVFLCASALLALSATAAAAAAPAECRKVVVSADPEFPPYAWFDGKTLRGASVDVVLTILRGMDLPYELRYAGPFARLLRFAETGEVDIITELKRNAEREAFLAFSDTAIFSNPTSVFMRAGETIKNFHGREDLRKRHGGVTRATRFGNGLDEYVAHSLDVEDGPGIQENFLKLKARRIDYFISPHFPAETYLVTSGQEDKYTVLKPFVAVAPVFVGWSKKSACIGRLAEFDARLKHYVSVMDSPRLIQSNFADWRKDPVMIR